VKYKQLFLATAVVAGLIAVACISQEASTGAGIDMTKAADKLVTSLDADQKKKALFKYDDAERFNWNFVPLQDNSKKSTRKGLPLEEMTAEQKDMARALIKAGTSAAGYEKATTIMSLEAILKDLEKSGAMVRNPQWYFFTVFGKPSTSDRWGWRVEGHHLSLNFVIDKGKLVASTPAFFGANPADVKEGSRKGLRVLKEAEVHAQELFAALDADQQKVARQDKQFPEIEQKGKTPEVRDPVGLPAAKMTDKQKEILMNLIRGYATRMPAEVASAELAKVKAAGIDKIYFAFARNDDKPGKPYTYRVQGPTFVIMFLDVQADSAKNPANHIHSVWRNLKGDFGL
jgi:hypothetical protein